MGELSISKLICENSYYCNMKIYNLNSKLQFGKFKGSTLERIYVGKDYLTEEEKYKLINEYSSIFIKWEKSFLSGEVNKIDITKTPEQFIQLQSKLDIKKDKEVFDHSMFVMDRTNGRKSYIEWCITTLNHFCIDPDELFKLEQLDYIICQNIEIIKFEKINLIEYDVDFRLNTKKMKSNFSEHIKNINLEKFSS